MTHTWNYRITFLNQESGSPDITVQNACNLEEALNKAKRHVCGPFAKILKTEIKHRFGWERC